MASGAGSPCGACKFLRRKCAAECVFAPYFCSEQGAARFAAIHKVFGASNVSKLLLHVPVADRCEAVLTIAYEAQARIRDPVYGCVAHIFALQQQVAYLQAQLMQAKSQLSQNLVDHQSSSSSTSRHAEIHEWNTSHGIGIGIGSSSAFPVPNYGNYYSSNISPQSSLDSMEHQNDGMMQEIEESSRVNYNYNGTFQGVSYTKKRPSQTDLGELQALAFRMMKNEN